MHSWEAIQITLNYIEEHIDEEIKIQELSKIAALSLFYYQRLFARLVKKPVREYIKLRRLSRACDALRNKQNRIRDVTVDYGFSNHETFTRAFKDTYGMTPAQYRNKPVVLDNFDKPDLMLNYVMVDENIPLISDGLVLEYSRKTLYEPINFLGIKDFYHFKRGKMLGERPGVSEPATIWGRFFDVCKDIPRIPGGRLLGVSYRGDAPEGYSTYFVGAEIERGTDYSRFAYWELPAREYVVCRFEAENFEQLFSYASAKAMKHARFWLREHGLMADGFFPEIYYHDSSKMAYMEMWIPFRQRENVNKI